MITCRQIERLWDSHAYGKLVGELLAARAEDSPRLRSLLSDSLAAAALGLIRLDELTQSHAPVAAKFVRRLLASQNVDGGWNDPLTTALCIRALLTSRGQGPAIDRAIAHLRDMQKTEGAWPKEPIRRLDADAFTSAFILFTLGGHGPFIDAIRLNDALAWFDRNGSSFDAPAKKLWESASLKLGARRKIRFEHQSAQLILS